jgi:hypothetical protein
MNSTRLTSSLQIVLIPLMFCLSNAVQAQANVYRCGGSPVMYTSDQRWAKEQGCSLLGSANERNKQSAPVQKRSSNSATDAANTTSQKTAPVTVKNSSTIYGSTEQKARDSDQLSILNNELRDEKARLEVLNQKLSKDASASTAGADSELKKSISRSQSDIVALEREIARMR